VIWFWYFTVRVTAIWLAPGGNANHMRSRDLEHSPADSNAD
jgi:hypothetical protein